MGSRDAILEKNEGICAKHKIAYVNKQYICADDSHYTYTQKYHCPLCRFSLDKMRKIAKRRYNSFIESEVPKENMVIILKHLFEKDGNLPVTFTGETLELMRRDLNWHYGLIICNGKLEERCKAI
jgi:hypothetical protein